MQATSIHFLFRQISQGYKEAFNQLFYSYYGRLVGFAMQYVKQQEPAEEVVSSLFVSIWQKRDRLPEIGAPEAYLFVATRNGCLNYLQRSAKWAQPVNHSPDLHSHHNALHAEYKELEAVINAAVERLPEQRKMIFRLIKEEGLKTKEVAIMLSVSARTVENQLYRAVKTLASAVSGYLGYHPQEKPVKRNPFLLFF